jgi:two-component system sensor histidine kinase HydH
LDENLPLVAINYNQIIEVLLNMFINAIDAMEDGGSLTVTACRHIDEADKRMYVQIRIQDSGKGIEAEYLDRVFDRYFTTKSTGTGLGLAVVERIIKAHNGRIEVKSKVGRGSTFIINLPVG